MNKEKMKKEIASMLDQMEGNTEDIRESMEDAIDEAKEKAQEMRRSANKYVVENPERSVLISAGIGLAVGAILGILMKSKGHCRHCKD